MLLKIGEFKSRQQSAFLYYFLFVVYNKYMALLIFVLISLFIILVLLFPLNLKLQFYTNALKNKTILNVKFLFFNVFTYLIEIKNDKFFITNKKGVTTELKIKVLPKFGERFLVNVMEDLYIEELFVIFKGGVKNDAYKTSMFCGAVNSALSVFFNLLKNKQDTDIKYKFSVSYESDILTVATEMKIKFCLWLILQNLAKTILEIKGAKNGNKKAKSGAGYSK